MWSDEKCAGLALAALMWNDRALNRAALTPELAELARDWLVALDESSTVGDKQRSMRRLVDLVHGDLQGAEHLPARGRVLLACHVPRDFGRRLVADAPETRREYSAPEELVKTLLRMARLTSEASR